jgi:hypothetical protein
MSAAVHSRTLLYHERDAAHRVLDRFDCRARASRPDRLPQLIGVQFAACCPIATAFRRSRSVDSIVSSKP